MDEFEAKYEVIMTGTDLTSSVLSAALGRVGVTVLHLDNQKFYGKEWRSVKLSDLFALATSKNHRNSSIENDDLEKINEMVDQTEQRIVPCLRPNRFTNIEMECPVFQCSASFKKFFSLILKTSKLSANDENEFLDDFYENFYLKIRKHQSSASSSQADVLRLIEDFKNKHMVFNRLENLFIFDLCPRFLFSCGRMVQTLIDSTITKYVEFKKVSQLLTPMAQAETSRFDIVEVPCTRSDIFKSNILTLFEKRYLMSFLEKCYHLQRHREWYESYESRPFREFLLAQSLTEKLQKFIPNTMLMMSDLTLSTPEALRRIQIFLQSFGRFCDRPMLFPMYGNEDLIQAFCRYGAVWGVTYCLGTSIDGVYLEQRNNNQKFLKSVLVGQKLISCDHLITDYQLDETDRDQSRERHRMSRAIVLSTVSIKSNTKTFQSEEDGNNLSFIHLPPDYTGHASSVYCFETDWSTRVCPPGFYIQYFWCDSTNAETTAINELKPIIEKLLTKQTNDYLKSNSGQDDSSLKQDDSSFLNTEKKNFFEEFEMENLLSFYYNCEYEKLVQNESSLSVANIHHVSPPINELDYEFALNEAEIIFKNLFPTKEFFPVLNDDELTQSDTNDNNDGPQFENDPLDEIEL